MFKHPNSSKLSLIAGKNLPVFIDQSTNLCYQLKRANIPHRVFIITIPKSGTYLMAKILENLGIVNCYVHIATDHMLDNRFLNDELLRVQPGLAMVHIPIEVSIQFIYPGQFSFGHIPFFDRGQNLLQDFKKIFTYRDMRDIIISLVRYSNQRKFLFYKPEKLKLVKRFKECPFGTDKITLWFSIWGKEYSNLIASMVPWKDRDDIFKLKFEEIMGDQGEDSQLSVFKNLAAFLELNISDNKIEKALLDSIGSETITYSGKRSTYREWWNEELEELFISYEFKELNRIFGYE